MSYETTILKLSEISKKAVSIAAQHPVHELLTLFQSHPELLIIAIADGGVFLGSISRTDLMNLLSRKFAMDLYARKPVSVLLDDLWLKKVVLRPELSITAAALQLLTIDPDLKTDAFPIVKNGHCVGVVAVADLMLAVVEQQRSLLKELDRLSAQVREAARAE
jgi:phosphoserine phosphatase RsbU/P